MTDLGLGPFPGRCLFPGCGGVVDEGYCTTCGRAPRKQAAATGVPAGAVAGAPSPSRPMPTLRPASLRTRPGSAGRPSLRASSGRTGSGRTSSRRTGSTHLGLGLVNLPAMPSGDPADAVMAVAEVPEPKRYCSSCDKPVGRSRGQRPGRTEGFCPHCGRYFSFTPKLLAGDVLAGQYEVLGAIAHGGLGWVYLARDRAVSDRWVVLKGLLDASSEDAALAAVAERRFLAAIDHPSIVQIYNFVTHQSAGYIVMEYVGGKSLKTVLQERREAKGGAIDPLPCDEAIAYMLGVLPAMAHLHDAGLVYCDMKPDNVVLTGNSLKIIDLGGVRRIDDQQSAIYGTIGYQAPEVAEIGPTPASDLYTVGRTLAVLALEFTGYQSTYADRLPPPDEQPLLARHESLHRFLLKATAIDPADRFFTAEEMAEQLLGILRENAAARGEAPAYVSTVFGADGSADVGLDELGAEWRRLPRPKVDPGDPGAAFLLGLADHDPEGVVATLTAAWTAKTMPVTTETLLRLARAHLEVAAPDEANATLDSLDAARDWRLWWHRGLVALAQGKAVDAVDWLDPVYTDLPGEVAPKLALGLAHEMAGDLARSAELYDRAGRTDPASVFGDFGLARVRLAQGDRAGAVDALGRVAATSSAYGAARLASVRALSATIDMGVSGPQGPSPHHLEWAAAILDQLGLESRRAALLEIELLEAGLAALANGAPPSGHGILGRPWTEPALREGLEAAYRSLARHASTPQERNRLVDLANRSRPRTLF